MATFVRVHESASPGVQSMAEDNNSRSGRVVVPATQTKTIIIGGFTGTSKAIYRIFNGGKNGTVVTVTVGTGGGAANHTLDWKDSIDLVVDNGDVSITAGANEANVIYDLLGMTG